MRINERMKVRTVAGENIVIMQGDGGADMTKVVALNESSMLLYEKLSGRDFEMADIVQLLTDTYEVDPATARSDAEVWVEQMRRNSLIV